MEVQSCKCCDSFYVFVGAYRDGRTEREEGHTLGLSNGLCLCLSCTVLSYCPWIKLILTFFLSWSWLYFKDIYISTPREKYTQEVNIATVCCVWRWPGTWPGRTPQGETDSSFPDGFRNFLLHGIMLSWPYVTLYVYMSRKQQQQQQQTDTVSLWLVTRIKNSILIPWRHQREREDVSLTKRKVVC